MTDEVRISRGYSRFIVPSAMVIASIRVNVDATHATSRKVLLQRQFIAGHIGNTNSNLATPSSFDRDLFVSSRPFDHQHARFGDFRVGLRISISIGLSIQGLVAIKRRSSIASTCSFRCVLGRDMACFLEYAWFFGVFTAVCGLVAVCFGGRAQNSMKFPPIRSNGSGDGDIPWAPVARDALKILSYLELCLLEKGQAGCPHPLGNKTSFSNRSPESVLPWSSC